MKKIFLSDYIIMVKITEYKLRRTAKNKGIIGYQNKSKRKLLKDLYKLKRITENLSMHKLKINFKNAEYFIK